MARNANSPRSLPPKVTCADPARSISSHSSISVIRHRPVKTPAKLGARLVMSPDQLRQSDQIACGRRKGQRPIADEVNKLARFDAEIHMPTSVSALAELMVRIHSPPAKSRQTSVPRGASRARTLARRREGRSEPSRRPIAAIGRSGIVRCLHAVNSMPS